MYGFLGPRPLQLDNLNGGSRSPPKLVSVTPYSGVLSCVFGDIAQLDCVHLTVSGEWEVRAGCSSGGRRVLKAGWGWISPKDVRVLSPVRLSGRGISSPGPVAAASSNSKEVNWLSSNCERSASNSSSIVSIKPSYVYVCTEIVLLSTTEARACWLVNVCFHPKRFTMVQVGYTPQFGLLTPLLACSPRWCKSHRDLHLIV